MSAARRVARPAAVGLFVIGLLALGQAAIVVIDARTYQAVERQRFERLRIEQPARTMTAASALTDGRSIGEIRIPRLGLTAIVAQGDSAAVLRHAVGHIADTALPGEPGNVVLAGHRDTFFRPLRRVRVGDAITVMTRSGDFQYVVESTAVVSPSDLDVIRPTDRRTLTLITCFPFSYVGPAPDRFIVRAQEVAASR